MSSQSFADLGVSRAVVEALAEGGINEPFPVQELVVPDVPAGRDVLVKSPTGSGKTLAFGVPIVDRIAGRRSAARRRWCSRPPASWPARSSTSCAPLAHARALSIAAVYGGAGIERQAKRAAARHILVATPGRLEDLIDRGAVRSRSVRCSSSTRPTACSTWASAPPSTASSSRRPRERQTLFFSATLDGEVGRVAASYTRDARRHEHAPTARASAATSSTASSPSRHEHKLDALVARAARRRARPHARLRAHQARRRPAGQAPARARHRPRVAMHGNKTQSPAREGAGPLRARATSTRSWPPTSPPAASTSTASPT